MLIRNIYTVGGNLATLNNGSSALFTRYNYNPLGLPANTIRVRTSDGNAPTKSDGATYETATLVHGTNDVYDVYKSGTSLSQVLYNSSNVVEVLGANTSNVTDMSYMLSLCHKLKTVPLFDTSNVTNMCGMFSNCWDLLTVPLFDTSNVTDMSHMFEYCYYLTTFHLFDTSNVTDMSHMFRNCYELLTVPLFDSSNVIDMSYMFSYCANVQSCALFDTSHVTDMTRMFERCAKLTSVPLFDTSHVTDMTRMFERCIELTSVPLFDTADVTSMNSMFYNCGNVQSGALALYQQASTQVNPPSTYDSCFTNCGSNTDTGAAELAQIPTSWGGTMQ